MRSLMVFGFAAIASLALFAYGCGGSDDSYPNNPAVSDAGTNLDGHLGGDNNNNGATCATACDCQPGLACQNGHCVSGASNTYCCEASTCPSGQTCQSMNGSFSQCTTPTTGANGSNGGNTGSSGGAIGGLTGGLGGNIGGLGGFGDGGIIGGLTGGSGGLIGGLGGTDDGGAGGIIGGLSGGSSGGNPICSFINCTQDSDCTGLGCTMCGGSGTCQ